ncbi:hypothetical protein ExPUPEC61_04348 [Escherichia coli]|nr:hypothetical protein ExPUPEC61_04348 [Escherichia coli]CSE33297.1 Uncharacterised protein [Shigella sonnei]CSQ80900.1 Uncharacterised protein [Shigella sonnei]
MIRNDGQTVIFALNFTHETSQERFNQFFWLCGFTFFFTVDHRDNSVAMHDFFHLRRRNEITFLRVDFQEAKAFFCGFYHPFSAWRLGMQLLFKLR